MKTDRASSQKIQNETQEVIDGKYKFNPEHLELGLDKTIFHALLESNLPSEEKRHSRLWQEGQVVIGAGADTTSNTLTVIHFYLLDNATLLEKLRKELEEAMPNKFELPKLSVVEKLPYLVSCMTIVNKGHMVNFGHYRALSLMKA
jgi:cytochrome P450